MNRYEMVAHNKRRKQFLATPLGAAFSRYERTHAHYWQLDGDPDSSLSELRKVDEKLKEKEDVLMPLLYEAAGIKK